MCKNHESPFANLEDSSEWDGSRPARSTGTNNPHVENIGNVEIPMFEEKCPKCRGTGNWRTGYTCFKCKGKGKLTFKTAPEARQKARKAAQRRKVKQAEMSREALIASLPEDVREWLLANEASSQFAAELLVKGAKYDGLTEGQIGGVRKCIAREADAADKGAQWGKDHEAEYKWLVSESANGNELANDLLNGKWGLRKRGFLTDNQVALIRRKIESEGSSKPSDIDLSVLELHKTGGGAERSYFAPPNGKTRLKLCIRRPGKNSRYHGWTFVDDGAVYGQRRTYGKQAPGGTYQGDVQDALRAILADPLEAAIAYGKLTSVCGVCGKALEDPESVAAGIGPVCASKY